MPKNKGPRISPNTRLRELPLSDITSTLNQLQHGASVRTEEARVLRYKALLAEARRETNEAQEHQPQQPASSKGHRGDRGQGFTLRERMEMVEIFRHNSNKITATNFGNFMDIPIKRQSITQWNKNFDKIKFDVAHGRGDKCTLSSNPVDLIQHILDKAVYEWLLEVRKNNGVVSGLQLQAAAGSVLHILMDDIFALDDIPLSRTISFTASWRSRMTQDYSVAYCSLRGEAGSVNKDAIAERMNAIRNICSNFEPDDIYNCDETGLYLKELSVHSYTMEELASGAKPKRGAASRVSILFCVNASGSLLVQARTVKALRPLVIGRHLARGIRPLPELPIISIKHEKGYMTLDLFKAWLHSLDDSLNKNSLLLINSCGAHGKSSSKDPSRSRRARGKSIKKDPLEGETWKHLRIERLPPNSTSVTQPLDAGIISAFKRHYLEMLSNKSVTKEYATGKKITNGEAWSLIPYAWSHVKALTVRHCFCKVGVLSKAQVDKLEQESMNVKERPPQYPLVAAMDASQARRHYVRLIASVTDGDRIQFSLDKNQKDEQDMAEEIKQKVRNKIAKRYSSRDRSSSIEADAVESFQSKYKGDRFATEVVEMLTGEDASDRKAARHMIRRKSQQK